MPNQPKRETVETTEVLYVSGLPKGLKAAAKLRAAQEGGHVNAIVSQALEAYVNRPTEGTTHA